MQLEGTVDLDERRLIRSAIRDLRRREIEDMEAALASKRFRPTRLKQQEDKENQHRYARSGDKMNVKLKLFSFPVVLICLGNSQNSVLVFIREDLKLTHAHKSQLYSAVLSINDFFAVKLTQTMVITEHLVITENSF